MHKFPHKISGLYFNHQYHIWLLLVLVQLCSCRLAMGQISNDDIDSSLVSEILTGGYWDSTGIEIDVGGVGEVRALNVLTDSTFYLGGRFSFLQGKRLNSIAYYNGNDFETLGEGIKMGDYPGDVKSLFVHQNLGLIVGGFFNQVGGKSAQNIARYQKGTWVEMNIEGVDISKVNKIVGDSSDVYIWVETQESQHEILKYVDGFFVSISAQIAGEFYDIHLDHNGALWLLADRVKIEGDLSTELLFAYRKNEWTEVPGGPGFMFGYSGAMNALSDGRVFVAGQFRKFSNDSIIDSYLWSYQDDKGWKNYGGDSIIGKINAIEVGKNDVLYLGGSIQKINDVFCNSIVKMVDEQFIPCGNGVPGIIGAMGLYLGRGFLLVSGSFFSPYEPARTKIARWINAGTSSDVELTIAIEFTSKYLTLTVPNLLTLYDLQILNNSHKEMVSIQNSGLKEITIPLDDFDETGTYTVQLFAENQILVEKKFYILK